MDFQTFKVTVSARAAALQVDVNVAGSPVLTKAIPATHAGLQELAGDLQAMPGVQVQLDPSLTHPAQAGLPEGYDAVGFVNSAWTLARLGWHSSPGGEA